MMSVGVNASDGCGVTCINVTAMDGNESFTGSSKCCNLLKAGLEKGGWIPASWSTAKRASISPHPYSYTHLC